MQKNMVEASALAALLLGAALACGQQPAGDKTDQGKERPAKSKLEEMLDKALHDNPDVRLAAAKVAEAEAELSRTRLLVVQKVASAYQADEAQKAAVEKAEADLKAPQGLGGIGGGDPLKQALIDAKAKLAQLEAELAYLLGEQPKGAQADLGYYLPAEALVRRDRVYPIRDLLISTEQASVPFPQPSVQGPTADRIRAALDKPFTLECKGKPVGFILHEMSNAFQEANPGLLLKVNLHLAEDEIMAGLSVHFDQIPFGAALEWLEDTEPGCRVVVRDYGLVISPKDLPPPGAPLLHDFWKGGKAEVKDETKTEAKDQPANTPAKNVEGVVKDVDKDGRIHIDVGKKAGLAKGDVLTVLRIRPETEVPLYLAVGRIRVVEVGDCDAVAEPADKAKSDIQPGDKVRVK
jgi:hypothetical protein